jgi:hypothetical protein
LIQSSIQLLKIPSSLEKIFVPHIAQKGESMKKGTYLLCLLLLVFISACGGKQSSPPQEASQTPASVIAVNQTPTQEAQVALPGAPDEPGESNDETQTGDESQSPPDQNSNLYDPSIYVIEASGTYRMELAPGYYADYEVEIYLDKVDSNDNRVVTGSYQGGLWIKTTIDAKEYIKENFGDAPVTIQFDAGGEAVNDNFSIYLNTTDDKAWTDYSILDDQGNPKPLTRDMPVAKGGTIAVSKNVYLDAKARGVQGEKVDYHDAADGEAFDVNYIIHVEENGSEVNAKRKVTFFLSGEGFAFTIEGTLTRLAGYPQDVLDYANNDRKNKFSEYFQ